MAEAATTETTSHRVRLLVVEDDVEVRTALCEMLEEEGYSVRIAASLEAGVKAVWDEDFALVLSDFNLAGEREPWPQIERLRDAAKPVRVAILTGWGIDREEVQRRGFAFVMRKPFDLETLFALIAEHAAPSPVPPRLRQAVERYFDALTRKDWDALTGLCAEDVTYHLPGKHPVFSRSVRGREDFRKFSEATFQQFADARFTVQAVIAVPYGVVGRYRGTFTAANGELVDATGSVMFRFTSGDLISEIGVRTNVRLLAEKAHVVPQ